MSDRSDDIRRGRRSLAAICATLGVLVVVGCSAPRPGADGTEPAPIAAMTPSAKRAAIATSFPAEVPVPVGDFIRAEAQGEDAWDYVIEVPTSVDELVAWYRDAYVGRQWELLDAEPFSRGSDAGFVMRFRKANAESSVSVYRSGDVGPVRAAVTLGVGAPVLQTQ